MRRAVAVVGWLTADGTCGPACRAGDATLPVDGPATPSAVEATVRCDGRAVARLRVQGERIERVVVDAYADALGSMCELVACRQRAAAQRRLLARARVLHHDPGDDPVSLVPDGPRGDVPVAAGETPPGHALRERLTARQREVLDLLTAGRTNDEIAEHLMVAIPTVKSHVRAALRALGAVNRAEAVARVALPPRRDGGRRPR